jgi:AraC-like DNA-binding protein
MDFSWVEQVSYFGGILGLIIATVVLTRNRGRREVKLSLAFLIGNSSLLIIFGALSFSGKVEMIPHLLRFDSPLGYLVGPVAFFYTYVSVKKDFRYRNVQLLHLLPAVINFFEFLPFYLSSRQFKLNYYNEVINNATAILPFHYKMKSISVGLYFILQLYFFIRLGMKKPDVLKQEKYLFSWFIVFFVAQVIMLLGIFTDLLTGMQIFGDPYRFAMLMVNVFVYITTIGLLFNPRMLYGFELKQALKKQKYDYSILSEDDKKMLLNQWKKYIDREKSYLNPNLNIRDVAKEFNTNSQYLSQVINELTGLSFKDYINKLRVEESKKILLSNNYNILTIDAIAAKAGFNSKSAFYRSFNSFTGLTPRQFVDQQKTKHAE